MTAELQALSDHIASSLREAITHRAIAFRELTVVARGEDIVEVVRFLRDDPQCLYISLIDICGADYPGREKRFDVVYHFLSPRHNRRIRVKVEADDVTPVPSIIELFPGANWFEREAYDLSTGCSSPGTRTCAGSSPTTASRVTPCARISRSRAMWRSATTTRRAASSTSP
jgi:NADH-quinone oxidoreductase subunit C